MSENTDRVRRVVRVGGRVQGVGFRYAAQAEAERLGITGTVRNLVDGTVEADVEGEPEAVESMCAWLREGPSSAHVESTDVREAEPSGAEDFRIGS